MLRKPNSAYEIGRSQSLFKYKVKTKIFICILLHFKKKGQIAKHKFIWKKLMLFFLFVDC